MVVQGASHSEKVFSARWKSFSARMVAQRSPQTVVQKTLEVFSAQGNMCPAREKVFSRNYFWGECIFHWRAIVFSAPMVVQGPPNGIPWNVSAIFRSREVLAQRVF